MKLNPRKRKPKPKPCPPPPNPVKYAHLCEINRATATGSEAWEQRNSQNAQRVDANRAIHLLTGDHATAVAEVAKRTKGNKNTTIDTVQTRTLARIARELEKES